MGNGWIIDTLDPDGGLSFDDSEACYVVAPSLRTLPFGFPLVIATLPVVDWNGTLLAALLQAAEVDRPRCYAAVMMIDPFTLWDDLADLFKNRGIQGVVNFPPASIVESSQVSDGLEIERLRWFSDAGFKLAFSASSEQEAEKAMASLPGLISATIHLPAAIWEQPVMTRMRVGLSTSTQGSAGS